MLSRISWAMVILCTFAGLANVFVAIYSHSQYGLMVSLAVSIICFYAALLNLHTLAYTSKFKPGQIVVDEYGTLWQLECDIGKAWGVSSYMGNWTLNKGAFRLATPKEARNFHPLFITRNFEGSMADKIVSDATDIGKVNRQNSRAVDVDDSK